VIGNYPRVKLALISARERARIMSKSISWGELAELTHVTQVEQFNFCMCEDLEPHEYPYPDCVKELA
jgi:hypothetical protein